MIQKTRPRTPGKRPGVSVEPMKKDKAAPKRKTEIRALSALSDEDVDTNDIPEVMVGVVRGKFYRPVKKSISIRGE